MRDVVGLEVVEYPSTAWVLPHNVLTGLDPVARRFRLLEPAVS